jgi:tetratricopeptide (TPR) repeat protein
MDINEQAEEVLLQAAFQHHQAGRLPEAEAFCRRILQVAPDNADALHLSGLIAYQTGKIGVAIELVGKALCIAPSSQMYLNLGSMLRAGGKLEAAIESYHKALLLKPDYAEVHNNLGNVYKLQGKLDEAAASLRKACSFRPNYAEAHNNLGIVYRLQGKLDEAANCFRKALSLKPDYIEARNNLGNVYRNQGRLDEAVDCFRKVLSLRPASAEAHNNLGNTFKDQGKPDEALASYDRAIAFKPDYAEAWSNRGLALQELKQLEAALASYDRAIAIGSDYAEAWSNRGLALQELRRLDEALASYDRAIALKPDYVEAWSNRGLALQELRRLDEALASYDRAIAIRPDYAQGHSNKSHLLLLLEDFDKGWEEYEWRWKKSDFGSIPLVTDRPQWEPGKEKVRLLVWAEQGIGDHIFFGGLLPEVAERVGQVMTTVDARLIPLFSRSMPGIRFFPSNETVAEELFDAHIPLGSLCRYLRNSAASFTNSRMSYLVADRERAKQLRQQLCPQENFLVGISWRSINEKSGRKRTIELAALASMFAGLGIKLVNLQYGEVDAEIADLKARSGVEVLQCASVDNFRDLDGLASLIDACDLVVSSDNSTVHLAGALGKPTWIMLPYVPDWRWAMNRTDSPWYPTVRLYRQDRIDDWGGVFERVREDLLRTYNLG